MFPSVDFAGSPEIFIYSCVSSHGCFSFAGKGDANTVIPSVSYRRFQGDMVKFHPEASGKKETMLH
jgi:hypothetical protein